jgi:hypothetical protein
MVKCSGCPCNVFSPSITHHVCSITNKGICYDDINFWHMPDNTLCELKQIELKDGTIFRPEEA